MVPVMGFLTLLVGSLRSPPHPVLAATAWSAVHSAVPHCDDAQQLCLTIEYTGEHPGTLQAFPELDRLRQGPELDIAVLMPRTPDRSVVCPVQAVSCR